MHFQLESFKFINSLGISPWVLLSHIAAWDHFSKALPEIVLGLGQVSATHIPLHHSVMVRSYNAWHTLSKRTLISQTCHSNNLTSRSYSKCEHSTDSPKTPNGAQWKQKSESFKFKTLSPFGKRTCSFPFEGSKGSTYKGKVQKIAYHPIVVQTIRPLWLFSGLADGQETHGHSSANPQRKSALICLNPALIRQWFGRITTN